MTKKSKKSKKGNLDHFLEDEEVDIGISYEDYWGNDPYSRLSSSTPATSTYASYHNNNAKNAGLSYSLDTTNAITTNSWGFNTDILSKIVNNIATSQQDKDKVAEEETAEDLTNNRFRASNSSINHSKDTYLTNDSSLVFNSNSSFTTSSSEHETEAEPNIQLQSSVMDKHERHRYVSSSVTKSVRFSTESDVFHLYTQHDYSSSSSEDSVVIEKDDHANHDPTPEETEYYSDDFEEQDEPQNASNLSFSEEYEDYESNEELEEEISSSSSCRSELSVVSEDFESFQSSIERQSISESVNSIPSIESSIDENTIIDESYNSFEEEYISEDELESVKDSFRDSDNSQNATNHNMIITGDDFSEENWADDLEEYIPEEENELYDEQLPHPDNTPHISAEPQVNYDKIADITTSDDFLGEYEDYIEDDWEESKDSSTTSSQKEAKPISRTEEPEKKIATESSAHPALPLMNTSIETLDSATNTDDVVVPLCITESSTQTEVEQHLPYTTSDPASTNKDVAVQSEENSPCETQVQDQQRKASVKPKWNSNSYPYLTTLANSLGFSSSSDVTKDVPGIILGQIAINDWYRVQLHQMKTNMEETRNKLGQGLSYHNVHYHQPKSYHSNQHSPYPYTSLERTKQYIQTQKVKSL